MVPEDVLKVMPVDPPGTRGACKSYPPDTKYKVAQWIKASGYTCSHAQRLLNKVLPYKVSSYALREWVKDFDKDDVGELKLRIESLELAFAKLREKMEE